MKHVGHFFTQTIYGVHVHYVKGDETRCVIVFPGDETPDAALITFMDDGSHAVDCPEGWIIRSVGGADSRTCNENEWNHHVFVGGDNPVTYINGRELPIVWHHTADVILADMVKVCEERGMTSFPLDLLKWMSSEKELASTLKNARG